MWFIIKFAGSGSGKDWIRIADSFGSVHKLRSKKAKTESKNRRNEETLRFMDWMFFLEAGGFPRA
jgi:hypothetical protein